MQKCISATPPTNFSQNTLKLYPMSKQEIENRLDDICANFLYDSDPFQDVLEVEKKIKAAIRQLVLESLPGEKTFISKNPINTPAQIKEIEQEAFTLGHNACLSSIKQSWEPIKA